MELQVLEPAQLTASLKEDICGFLDSQRTSHPFQFPQWSSAGSRFALVRRAGEPCWFASCGLQYPLGTRVRWFYSFTINRGPVCDSSQLWKAALLELTQYMKRERSIYLDVSPDRVTLEISDVADEFGTEDWEQTTQERYSLRLDLTKADRELFAAFRKNTRYEVRRAERMGVLVDLALSESDVQPFLELYLHMTERKHFAPDAPNHLHDTIRWLQSEPSRGALLVARFRGVIFGGAIIVRAGNRCWYVWGASEKHNDFTVGHLLQWRALLWAKSHGCTEYDFGGYTVGATSGPAWFKQGFGGKVISFPPVHRKVLRPSCHKLLRIVSRIRS